MLVCLYYTYIDVLGQKLVRYAVFVDDIVVHAGAGSCRTHEETEKSGSIQLCCPIDMVVCGLSGAGDSMLQQNIVIAVATCKHLQRPVPLFHSRNTEFTDPPLKAPTGFLTGAITASALNTALVWKLRATTGALVAVRNTGRRMRDAIAGA